MSKTAFVFPGQGSQQVGMGKETFARYEQARKVFETADRTLGFSLSALCFEGPEETLRLTENTQPAILAVSIALFRVLEDEGARPDFVAGHSLGEYSALVAAGALELEDALGLVRKRGRYMQEAVPVGEGAMAAILGLSPEMVISVCREAAAEGRTVEPANFNGAGQVVIAGHAKAVERAAALAKERGARRAVPLPVSAPFHCRLMRPAAERLKEDLQRVTFSAPQLPVVTNVDARPIKTAHEARDALERQVASPVRWEESIQRLAKEGVTRFVEVGPGRILSGLVRKIAGGSDVASVQGPEEMERLVEEARRG